MPIRRKLILTISGISIASVMLTVAAIIAYVIYDMRESTRAQVMLTATIAADRNAAAVMFLDTERADKNLSIYKENPSIVVACVYDAMGLPFASYTASGAYSCPTSPQQLPTERKNILTALKEIRQAGQLSGYVFIASDTREIDEYVARILLISGSITSLVLLATILLAFYFQRTISGPIVELMRTAKSITESRNYTLTAQANSKDETGQLASAFNDMIAEVRKRDEELSRYNETLEIKVIERTHQLEESKKRAEAASEAKSEFLRNMSHEFRTPLHALVSFSSYGLKEHETAERSMLKQYFDLIAKSADRLSKLVNEVLDLAKMEHGEQVFNLQRTNMLDLLTHQVDLIRALAQEKGLSIHIKTGDEPVLTVCDYDKIGQVVTNLLGNAIKFTPSGRSITMELATAQSASGPVVSVAVIDEGIGIPDNELAMIFDSFRQSSRTNTGAGGTGLGLAICRRIISAHGGRIWAENNTAGSGARVTFVMPAVQQEGKRTITLQEVETMT